jgi:hypothetical protein
MAPPAFGGLGEVIFDSIVTEMIYTSYKGMQQSALRANADTWCLKYYGKLNTIYSCIFDSLAPRGLRLAGCMQL